MRYAEDFLVEDDVVLRAECARLLSLDGFEVEECRHFADAANEVLTAHPDCIILDLKLPGTDGLSICRGIRAQSTVPIIILTSSDSEFDEVMGMNIGADDYIQKPYSPAILLCPHPIRSAPCESSSAAGAGISRSELGSASVPVFRTAESR